MLFEHAAECEVSHFAMQSDLRRTLNRMMISFVSGLIAVAIWIPSLQLLFSPTKRVNSSDDAQVVFANELAAGQLRFWRDPALKSKELQAMRGSNSEWDFMGRTFLVLS